MYQLMLHCFSLLSNCLFVIHTHMARTCNLCGRGSLNSIRRSHSNIANPNRQHLNLQTLVLNGKRVDACTSCIRRETKRLSQLNVALKKSPATV